jgi:hypothetical protein
MSNILKRFAIFAIALGWLTAATGAIAQVDPPTRVGRLSQISGPVSFAPAGEDEWVAAVRNRPIVTGDRLWVSEGSRAELQLGSAVLYLGSATSIAVLNLDDRIAQFRVEQGTAVAGVRRLPGGSEFELDTPNLALAARRPGEYRVDVDIATDSTAVDVRSGFAEVFGESVAYAIDAGQRFAFAGTRLEPGVFPPDPYPDALDRWAQQQERRYARSATARYVAPEVVGWEDLDDQGSWRYVESHGNVWVPHSVPAGWAPYRYGHWAWIEPWGWTWVDDAPWGFAPFHYGRWALVGATWAWVPGPVTVRPVYAPALVAFVGGSGFSLAIGVGTGVPGVAWFPLAPGEVYRPAYWASRNYFTNVNTSNTRVNVTNVTNIYNNTTNITNVNYAHRQSPAAVTAVPGSAFTRAESVGRARVAVTPDALARGRVVETAPVAPTQASVIGNAARATAKPRDEARMRQTIARSEPPAPPAPFATRQATLAATPGVPQVRDGRTMGEAARRDERSRVVAAPPAATPAAASVPAQIVPPRDSPQQPMPSRQATPPQARQSMAQPPAPEPQSRQPTVQPRAQPQQSRQPMAQSPAQSPQPPMSPPQAQPPQAQPPQAQPPQAQPPQPRQRMAAPQAQPPQAQPPQPRQPMARPQPQPQPQSQPQPQARQPAPPQVQSQAQPPPAASGERARGARERGTEPGKPGNDDKKQR